MDEAAGWLPQPLLLLPALLLAIHLVFRALSPRARPRPNPTDEEVYGDVGSEVNQTSSHGRSLGPRRSSKSNDSAAASAGGVCVVTGGTGFLGCAIVRHILALNRFNRVVVVDAVVPTPSSPRRMDGVDYVGLDLCDDAGALARALRGARLVVHTAGRVALYDDPALLFNAHVVATRRVVAAARRAGCEAMVVTSSSAGVTTPYTDAPQIGVPNDWQPPPRFAFPSHYARTKYAAETDAIAASVPGFAVCALRVPGVYGVLPEGEGDPMITGPLLSKTLTHIPSGPPGAAVDFCYVENAAAAHAAAAVALLDRPGDVAGKAINVANPEPFEGPVASWNELLFVVHGDSARPLRPLPYWVAFAAACVSEAAYAFTAGCVPWPRSSFWNLTRSTLGMATTAITLEPADPALGYTPPFDNLASFRDIKRKWVPPN